MKKLLLAVFVALILAVLILAVSSSNSDIKACFNQFKSGNYQMAIRYGKKAVKEYPNNPDSYFCLGKAYSKIGQIDKSIENLKMASEYTSNDRELMHIYSWLGNEYIDKGDDSNALSYWSKSLKLAEKFGNFNLEERDLNNIAYILNDKGDYSKALEYYKTALKLENGTSQTGAIYNNIASIYFNMDNYKKAIEYYKKAINVAEEHGNYISSGAYMLNLGDTYLNIGDFKDAKFYLEKGLERVKEVGNKRWEGIGYTYLGLYHASTGNKLLAKEYLKKALNMFITIGDDEDASAVSKALSYIKHKHKKHKHNMHLFDVLGDIANVLSILPSQKVLSILTKFLP